MTGTASDLRTLIDCRTGVDGNSAELAPLTEELVRSLDMPPDLPAELTIAQVSELSGITAHTLRYYERIGLVEVGRNPSGHRTYDRDALGRIIFITRLRSSNMPIRDIQRYIGLVKMGPETEPERLALLTRHRESVQAQMHNLELALAVVDYKILTYGGTCGASEIEAARLVTSGAL